MLKGSRTIEGGDDMTALSCVVVADNRFASRNREKIDRVIAIDCRGGIRKTEWPVSYDNSQSVTPFIKLTGLIRKNCVSA